MVDKTISMIVSEKIAEIPSGILVLCGSLLSLHILSFFSGAYFRIRAEVALIPTEFRELCVDHVINEV